MATLSEHKIWRHLGVAMICLMPLGCNRASGHARYDLTGSVTYAGKPVPAGYLLFAPDKSKGNDGPGANAEIKDGVYITRPKQGTVGGPHVATINGFDGKPVGQGPAVNPMGKALFTNVQIGMDLPKASTSYDIVIPTANGK